MSHRAAVVGVACLVLVSVAGCTGGSGGDDATSSVAPTRPSTGVVTSSSGTVGRSGTASASPSTTGSSTPGSSASGTSTSVPGASIAPAPDPVVAAGNAGAWTLTRAASGTAVSRQLATLQCGQDGSVTADGLSLAPGAGRLTLSDPAVTLTGTASLDAAGGTFRGRDATAAVAFTWIC